MMCADIHVEGMVVLLQLCTNKSENNDQYAENGRADRRKEIESLVMLLASELTSL